MFVVGSANIQIKQQEHTDNNCGQFCVVFNIKYLVYRTLAFVYITGLISAKTCQTLNVNVRDSIKSKDLLEKFYNN